MADFQNRLISPIFGVFSTGLFHKTTLTWLKNRFSHIFLVLIFEPSWLYCKSYSLCMMGDFQNRLFSRIFGVFSSGFLHRTTLTWSKKPFLHIFVYFNCWPKLTILHFAFLSQADYIAKAIAFAWWEIFKIVSFLEYLVFSQAVFCTEQL